VLQEEQFSNLGERLVLIKTIFHTDRGNIYTPENSRKIKWQVFINEEGRMKLSSMHVKIKT
jgi:hypothetical protein